MRHGISPHNRSLVTIAGMTIVAILLVLVSMVLSLGLVPAQAGSTHWGMWTDLATGSHHVCFGPVAGYTAPACQDVSVTAGTLTSATGTYP